VGAAALAPCTCLSIRRLRDEREKEEEEVTGTFDFIGRIIMKQQNKEINALEVLEQVFKFASGTVTNEYYELQPWCRRQVRQTLKPERLNLEDWDDYFSDVHDLDHATHHKAFTDRGYIIIGQLETMMTWDHIQSSELRSLLKYSKAAKTWFHENFIHHGYGTWVRKGSDFDR